MKNNSVKFGFYTSNRATRLRKFLSGPLRGNSIIGMVLHDGIPSDELKNLCDQNGIDLMAVDYVELGVDKSRRNKYLSDVLLEQLVARGVDYCFCFGSCILVGDLLRVFRNRIINFHPSLLPAFPGIKAVDQAIEYGARFLGNTAHFIDEGVDTGPIIMQSIISAEAFSGYDSVLDQQLLMLAQIIKWLEQGRIEVSGRKVNVRDAVCDDLTFMPNVEPDLLQKLL
ncbi:MAG TPA: formyltransferase family protein [Candidatus Omnitrophota bacterium]|nr:formyltransferase family protein [Candidatus Omnitrophota bacterium]HPS19400.1 formyltransferase family protein [Candidatus Omnitrophota bacterium]